MTDPFRIDSPTAISFSGGRTSAYMLHRVLESNGGLPDECVVLFANTGKEEEETLAFVRDCSARWRVPITWVEYCAPASFAVVDFDSASREGEPFDALIVHKRNYLPNPMQRFCTVDLKIMPMYRWLRGANRLESGSLDMMIGIRADEPWRVARQKSAGRRDETPEIENVLPLADAGVSKQDVLRFWAGQPFDLQTDNSNCDLCFQKPPARRQSLIAQRPSRAVWWIESEKRVGATFTKDGHTYAGLTRSAMSQADGFGYAYTDDEEALACFCGD